MKRIIAAIMLFMAMKGFSQTKCAPENLFQCWSASYEDDKENTKENTYRNCDYKFPPKMFRPTVKFSKDGTCQVLHLGATDIQSYVDCKWAYNKRKKRITVTNNEKKTEMKFRIKSIDKDVMKIVSEM